MNASKKINLAAVAAAILLLGLPGSASAVTGNIAAYTVTDIGASTPNPTGNSTAFALSQNGAVAGRFTTGTGAHHAFVWANGNVTDLGTLGGTNSSAVGIANVDGAIEIVGNSDLSGNTAAHAFVWSDGNMSDLGTLPSLDASTTNSFATGINSAGNIVGTSETGVTLNRHAFLFATNGTVGEGNFTDLGVFSGGNESVAFDIGDDNAVIGESEGFNGTSGNYVHAFITSNTDVLIDLGTLDDLGNSSARAINHAGVIIGNSATTSGNIHGFTFNTTTDVFTDLGVLGNFNRSHALAINSQDEVVGYVSGNASAPNDEHAFVYFDGTITDLNTLTGNSGWVLNRAYGVNDHGDIVGVGVNASGQEHAFLLVEKSPKIISQPLSVVVVRHGNVTLSVQASGVALAYQWFKENAAIRGATDANLTLSDVALSSQAKYHVVVSNSAGSIASANVRVTVIPFAVRPHAFVLPMNESVREGGTANFRALVIGTRPFTFQWQRNRVDLTDNAQVHGSQTTQLTIDNVTIANQGNYRIVVTNPAGQSTSAAARLRVR